MFVSSALAQCVDQANAATFDVTIPRTALSETFKCNMILGLLLLQSVGLFFSVDEEIERFETRMSRIDSPYNIDIWCLILYIIVPSGTEMNSLLRFMLQLFGLPLESYKDNTTKTLRFMNSHGGIFSSILIMSERQKSVLSFILFIFFVLLCEISALIRIKHEIINYFGRMARLLYILCNRKSRQKFCVNLCSIVQDKDMVTFCILFVLVLHY